MLLRTLLWVDEIHYAPHEINHPPAGAGVLSIHRKARSIFVGGPLASFGFEPCPEHHLNTEGEVPLTEQWEKSIYNMQSDLRHVAVCVCVKIEPPPQRKIKEAGVPSVSL